MANRQKVCKGKQSDSSCTCGSNHECQDDTNAPKHERNNNETTSAYNKQKTECSDDCINCKLLNRLYTLLEEIVENRKITKNSEETNKSRYNNDTKVLFDKNNEEIPKIKENFIKLPNNEMNEKNGNVFNVYNNNKGSNKLMLCDCDKTAVCRCFNNRENTPQVSKKVESTSRNSAQYWYSVGEIKKQNQVDIACQCTYSKKDSSTQDYSTQKKEISENNKDNLKKCNCADSAVNTDPQNNSCIQNLYYSLLNDGMFRDIMKSIQCPNVVVLSNGCSCCNKCNTPLERTSVTTNTSEIIVTTQEKNNEIVNRQKLDTAEINEERGQESAVTFLKNIVMPQKTSIASNEFNIGKDTPETDEAKSQHCTSTYPKKNAKPQKLSTASNEFNIQDPTPNMKILESSIRRSIKDLPSQSENNNDTTSIVPQTDFIVASALVTKSGKKKSSSKSKKRKIKDTSDSKESTKLNDKKGFINTCCQTEEKCRFVLQNIKDTPEEKCEYVLQNNKGKCEDVLMKTTIKVKDAGVCCDMNKCNALVTKLVEKPITENTEIKNNNINSCNCTDIQNFVTIITELCAQFNSTKEKSTEKVDCACAKIPEVPVVNSGKDDYLEIQRLAEKIAEIHLKSNPSKSGSPHRTSPNNFKRSVDLVKSTTSNCDLNNCIHINTLPSHNMPDNAEECYCKICPCKKTTKSDRRDVYSVKKEKKGRCSITPAPKRATKQLTESEFPNLNKWSQQYPSTSPQTCTCNNYECTEETEIDTFNYNISDYPKNNDNCDEENCPELRRIVKECLCGSKNCYCHNAKLNDIRTSAKLERLADEVINTITPCNCMGQQCACTNVMDPNINTYSTRQVCFSSIYLENQRKIKNNTDKGKKLFDKDVNGSPCLNGSKSETHFYINNLLNTKQIKNKACLKKIIPSSGKKLKSLTLKPLLPIPDTPCTQINYINSLFPEIHLALSKIKELTNWEILPQEIVEIVIDKILKREIKSALQQMREGVVKTSVNENKDNTNILNILLEDKIIPEEFKNNILDKHSEYTKQAPYVDKYTQNFCCEEMHNETINLTGDSHNNIQDKLENFNINQNDDDTNKKPILVQINIEKNRKFLSPKKNKISVENSCISLKENASSSSIYITEKKLGAIKDLITLGNNNTHQNWENNETDSSSILSIQEVNQPISININIQMDKDRDLNLKDSVINSDEVKTKDSSNFSLSKGNNENTETNTSKELEKSKIELEMRTKFMDDLQEKNKSINDDMQEKNKFNVDVQEKNKSIADLQESSCLYYHRSRSELPLLEDFLAMNKYMKVQKIKNTPKYY